MALRPQVPDLSANCKTYHRVADGDGCPQIEKHDVITLDQSVNGTQPLTLNAAISGTDTICAQAFKLLRHLHGK